jgi:ribonuclease T1
LRACRFAAAVLITVVTVLLGAAALPAGAFGRGADDLAGGGLPAITARELPAEARTVLALIERGGPFPYEKDGSTFGNFERRLPLRERGYYREYTVPTPGARDRGARRIVAGRGGERYYTDDHYRTFRRIREATP